MHASGPRSPPCGARTRAPGPTETPLSWGDLALHTTGIARRYWNGIHVSGPDTPWDEAAAWFAQRGMPWGVLVPSELDVVPPGPYAFDQPMMMRDLADLPELPELDLRWDAGEEASSLQAEAFDNPLAESRDFVLPKLVNDACAVVTALEDGVPVATATLVVVEGVAAVYGVGTAVAARRRGLGRAVTLAVMHEGLARGCDLTFLNPSELGYGVYRDLGFRDGPPFRIYSSP